MKVELENVNDEFAVVTEVMEEGRFENAAAVLGCVENRIRMW